MNISIWYRYDGLVIYIGQHGEPLQQYIMPYELLKYQGTFDEKALQQRIAESHCYHYHTESGSSILLPGNNWGSDSPVIDNL